MSRDFYKSCFHHIQTLFAGAKPCRIVQGVDSEEDSTESLSESSSEKPEENTPQHFDVRNFSVPPPIPGSSTLLDLPDLSHCQINVINEDCVETLFRVCNMGKKPLLLANNSNTTPGGGVRNGRNALEEQLCMISNLYQGLSLAKDIGLYPLTNPFIVERVTFFKRTPSPHARDNLQRPYVASILCSAAVKLSDSSQYTPQVQQEMERRIRAFLELAAKHQYKDLILTAFGSGCYCCPASAVAEIFYKVLVEDRMERNFDSITFSIINDSQGSGNYEAYAKVFS